MLCTLLVNFRKISTLSCPCLLLVFCKLNKEIIMAHKVQKTLYKKSSMPPFFCRKVYFPSQGMLIEVSLFVLFSKVMRPEFSDILQTPVISRTNLFHNACLKSLNHLYNKCLLVRTRCSRLFQILLYSAELDKQEPEPQRACILIGDNKKSHK